MDTLTQKNSDMSMLDGLDLPSLLLRFDEHKSNTLGRSEMRAAPFTPA
jgi:hypothetical protein